MSRYCGGRPEIAREAAAGEREGMLLQHREGLGRLRVVLASGSPRRRELLGGLGLEPEVVPSRFAEDLGPANFAGGAAYAQETAVHKALEVAGRDAVAGGRGAAGAADLVIGGDTVVESPAGAVLEKPADAEDAARMLRALSGDTHRVHTGVALVLPQAADPRTGRAPLVRAFVETTEVEFAELEEALVQAYVASGDPMDKAGAYGIQGPAGSFVRGIRGCYSNVVGLPLHRVTSEINGLLDAGLLAPPRI